MTSQSELFYLAWRECARVTSFRIPDVLVPGLAVTFRIKTSAASFASRAVEHSLREELKHDASNV